ncbi:hypothetical protein [Rhodococcus sp. KRD197]|uniref:hypothetical protein n=1 Tax=Rhodococcus sp. KRD197 TaxID=2729731 RepID=UPI0019D20D9A|nr:hypothetical protein [Rhodococcus sp. KRD197]
MNATGIRSHVVAYTVGAALVAVAAGCSSDASNDEVTAASVCAQIEDAGIGENCVPSEPGGLQVAATEVYDFDLISVPGEGGAVMKFDNPEQYSRTVESFEEAAFLAGPHRYGSDSALVFVQINEGLSADGGAEVKGIVDDL